MTKTYKPRTTFAELRAEFDRLRGTVDGPWELPIEYAVKDGIITGQLSLAVGMKLDHVGIVDAKMFIAAAMKDAILACAVP